MKGFKITTLGCKVNQYESEAIRKELQAVGFTPIFDELNVELCIINTCTVTKKASSQSRQAVRGAIRKYPKARIIVTGCYAQVKGEDLFAIKGVDDIICHEDKSKVPELIIASCQSLFTKSHKKIGKRHIVNKRHASSYNNRTRAFLKIQDGCNAFCTYCIVPHARGRSRSEKTDKIFKELNSLKSQGCREVVLTGIHLGQYGLDFSPKTSLFELLTKIQATSPLDRVRLSSIEPNEMTEDIIRLVARSENFCHHFHIPLQSGDNEILKRMGRPYTKEMFKRLVLSIHKSLSNAAIGVDIMVGFPGEGKRAFENTYSLVEELPISYLHVFPFSPHKLTPAGSYPDRISSGEIKKRANKIRKLGLKKKMGFYSQYLGKVVEILIESKRYEVNKVNYLKGMTSNYIPVLVKGDTSIQNTIVPVKLEKLNDSGLVFGTLGVWTK